MREGMAVVSGGGTQPRAGGEQIACRFAPGRRLKRAAGGGRIILDGIWPGRRCAMRRRVLVVSSAAALGLLVVSSARATEPLNPLSLLAPTSLDTLSGSLRGILVR